METIWLYQYQKENFLLFYKYLTLNESHHKEDCVEECDGEQSVEVDVP